VREDKEGEHCPESLKNIGEGEVLIPPQNKPFLCKRTPSKGSSIRTKKNLFCQGKKTKTLVRDTKMTLKWGRAMVPDG